MTSKCNTMVLAAVLLTLSLGVVSTAARGLKVDGGTNSGEATFYSDGTIGACSMNVRPDGHLTVALNSVQWDGGKLCGTCIEGYYEGGSGRVDFKAVIDNLCPECKWGDLDFRDPSGDGRWPLTWWPVACPYSGSGGLTVTRESGNKWYSKLKVEGGPSPVTSMTCMGMTGTRTSDAFFEFQDSSATFCKGVDCSVTFSDGASESLSVSGEQLGSFC